MCNITMCRMEPSTVHLCLLQTFSGQLAPLARTIGAMVLLIWQLMAYTNGNC